MRAGYEIFFLDESIFALIPYITRGWFVVGSRPTKKYIQTPYQKTCAFGALGIGKVVTKLSQKINGKKYLAFIKRLSKHHKNLCLIVDNARWHLTKEVLAFIKPIRRITVFLKNNERKSKYCIILISAALLIGIIAKYVKTI